MTWKSGRLIVSVDPQCEVLQLELPAGVQPNEVLRYPSGSLQEIRCTFAMQMTLFGDEGRGRLLEYRQMVRAGPAQIIRPNEEPQDLYLDTEWAKAIDGQWKKRSQHAAHHWIEDTKPVEPPPTTWRYGHRGDVRIVPAGEYSTEAYEPWWNYSAIDRPNLTFLQEEPPIGTRVVIRAAFQGSILDLSDGSTVVTSPVWTWEFDGQ
jgi:hypothetical protein